MIPFRTTPEQREHLTHIAKAMHREGLNPKFIRAVKHIAGFDQGMYDLMALWLEAEYDDLERNGILEDLENGIYEYAAFMSVDEGRS